MRSASDQRRGAVRLVQRVVSDVVDTGQTLHVAWGDGFVNTTPSPDRADPPVLIEVMETDTEAAIEKVKQVSKVNDAEGSQPRLAIAIELNQPADDKNIEPDNNHIKPAKKGKSILFGWEPLVAGCRQIAKAMEDLGVIGGCFPAVWSPTSTGGGYVFPFLEMRARTSVHSATQAAIKELRRYGTPVVRSMDSDVMHDPLLEGRVGVEQLRELTWNNDFVLSGGYNWDTSAPSDQPHPNRRGERLNFWLVPTVLATADDVRGTHELLRDSAKLNTKWANILTLVNNVEHNWRGFLASKNAALVYWPEPNTYMTANRRAAGAERILSETDRLRGSQQRESVFYLRDRASEGRLVGEHNKEIFTTKPVKTYFNWLRDMLVARVAPSVEQVCVAVESIRQTHLSPSHIEDIQKPTWYGLKTPVSEDVVSRLEKIRKRGVEQLAQEILTEIKR